MQVLLELAQGQALAVFFPCSGQQRGFRVRPPRFLCVSEIVLLRVTDLNQRLFEWETRDCRMVRGYCSVLPEKLFFTTAKQSSIPSVKRTGVSGGHRGTGSPGVLNSFIVQ